MQCRFSKARIIDTFFSGLHTKTDLRQIPAFIDRLVYLFFFAHVFAKTTATTARMATQDRWIVAAKSEFFIQ